MKTLQGFSVGDRVQLSPGLDRWVRGDRFGEVIDVGRKTLLVRMDKSGALVKLVPDRVTFA